MSIKFKRDVILAIFDKVVIEHIMSKGNAFVSDTKF